MKQKKTTNKKVFGIDRSQWFQRALKYSTLKNDVLFWDKYSKILIEDGENLKYYDALEQKKSAEIIAKKYFKKFILQEY